MLRRSRRFYSLPAAALLLATSLAGAAAPGMTVDDIVALLRAGVGERVILRQIETTGTEITLTVEMILKLKKAGATDDLLAALVDSPSAAPMAIDAADAAPSSRPFRVYREKNEKGEEVLHITNLDESGRRMGGEAVDQPQPNVVQGPATASGDRAVEGERYDNQPPVIVNIYPPEPQGPAIDGGYVDDGPSYSIGSYGGYLAGYLPGYSRHCPYARSSLGGHMSAAGSYSRNLRYRHAEPRGSDLGLFSQPRSFSTAPYRANTAAQRNRMRFGHQ